MFAADKKSPAKSQSRKAGKNWVRRIALYLCAFTTLRELVPKFFTISITAGTIYVAQTAPRIDPVTNRDRCVFSQMPKKVSDQSMPIGTSARKSHSFEIGSVFWAPRQIG